MSWHDHRGHVAVKKSREDLEQEAFERWCQETCPSGDVNSVQDQWLASDAYADFQQEAS